MLPHLSQETDKTQILPFYSFAAVQRDYPGRDAAEPMVMEDKHIDMA